MNEFIVNAYKLCVDSTVLPILLDLTKMAFATFVGAFFAFQIDKSHRRYLEKLQNFRSAKNSLFVFVSQYQALFAMNRQHLLDKKKEKEELRAFTLKPFSNFFKTSEIDINSLLFILDSGSPNLLNEIVIANQKFQSTIGVLSERNKVHLKFQELVATTGNVDPSTKEILISLTNSLYESFEDSMETNIEMVPKISTFLKNYYKKGKPLGFEPPKLEEAL